MEILSTREKIIAAPLMDVVNVTDKEIADAAKKLAQDPVKDGEKVIGQMSELEQAILAVIVKKIASFKEEHDFEANSPEAASSELGVGLDFGQDEKDEIIFKKIADTRSDLNFLGFTLKYLITGRLDVRCFALRENFKIVFSEEEEISGFESSLESACSICPLNGDCPFASDKKAKGKTFCARMRDKRNAEAKAKNKK